MFFYLGFIVIISCLKVGYIGDRISIKLDFEKIRIKSGLDVDKLPNKGVLYLSGFLRLWKNNCVSRKPYKKGVI